MHHFTFIMKPLTSVVRGFTVLKFRISLNRYRRLVLRFSKYAGHHKNAALAAQHTIERDFSVRRRADFEHPDSTLNNKHGMLKNRSFANRMRSSRMNVNDVSCVPIIIRNTGETREALMNSMHMVSIH